MERDIVECAERVWKWLQPQLPPRPSAPKGGRAWADDFKCLIGIVWVLKTGARWRDIPKDLGVSPLSCWRRHVTWSGEGLWQSAWAAALAYGEERKLAQSPEQSMDGMFVRAKKGVKTLDLRNVVRV